MERHPFFHRPHNNHHVVILLPSSNHHHHHHQHHRHRGSLLCHASALLSLSDLMSPLAMTRADAAAATHWRKTALEKGILMCTECSPLCHTENSIAVYCKIIKRLHYKTTRLNVTARHDPCAASCNTLSKKLHWEK